MVLVLVLLVLFVLLVLLIGIPLLSLAGVEQAIYKYNSGPGYSYSDMNGYGTSYITGKYLLESAMADFAKMKESQNQPFRLREFFDQLNTMGNIPISLGHWQMTGGEFGL